MDLQMNMPGTLPPQQPEMQSGILRPNRTADPVTQQVDQTRSEIVILTRSLPFHSLGGMEIVVWDLARQFARLGRAVRIITTSLPNEVPELVRDGVTIVALQGTPHGRYSSAWWRKSRRYFEQHCMETTAAVLSVSAGAFALLPLRRRLPGVPFVMQAHGTSWGEVISKWRSRSIKGMLGLVRNLWWLPKEQLAYGQFDAVVAVGPRVYDDLKGSPARYFLPSNKVHLINNGIDTALFRPSPAGRMQTREELGLNEETPVVVSASRLHFQKGVSHVLKAFGQLRRLRPDAILLVAGDGPDRARLEALSHELKQADHVRFLGALGREELAGVYQAGDAFVFLTEHQEVGLPLNGLEALATGLPCVVSNHLHLFPSSYLHPVGYADVDSAADRLNEHLKVLPKCRTSQLPAKFQLSESAQAYLIVLSPNGLRAT